MYKPFPFNRFKFPLLLSVPWIYITEKNFRVNLIQVLNFTKENLRLKKVLTLFSHTAKFDHITKQTKTQVFWLNAWMIFSIYHSQITIKMRINNLWGTAQTESVNLLKCDLQCLISSLLLCPHSRSSKHIINLHYY